MLITVVTFLILSLLLGIPALSGANGDDPAAEARAAAQRKEEARSKREVRDLLKEIKKLYSDIAKEAERELTAAEEVRIVKSAIAAVEKQRAKDNEKTLSALEKELIKALACGYDEDMKDVS